MGFMDKFEKGVEKAVKGGFKGGKTEVAPVELASRIRREMDDNNMALSQGRTLAPNVFEIDLSSNDYARIQEWGQTLADELCDVAIEHAKTQNYVLQGPVKVAFYELAELADGAFDLQSVIVKADQMPGASQSPVPTAAPVQASHHSPVAQVAAPTPNKSGVVPSPAAHVAAPAPTPVAPTPAGVPASQAQTMVHSDIRRGGSVKVEPLALPTRRAVLDLLGQRYTLNVDTIVLGRSTEVDIPIEDPGISRRHVQVYVTGDRAFAKDLGSTNGTYVNGRKISGETELTDGSAITLGHATAVFRWIDGA